MVITELLNDLKKAKTSQAELDKMLFAARHPVHARFHGCASFLNLREWLEHGGKTTVHKANFCEQHKLCRVCAIRRAAKLCAAYESKIAEVMGEKENQKLYASMITYTVKNGADLEDTLNHLIHSWRSVWARSRKELTRGMRSPLCCVKGGVCSVEIKRGKNSGLWHPHLHVLVLSEGLPNASKLSKDWHKETGDSYQVTVSPCKEGVMKGLIEVLKYITKFSETAARDVLEIYEKTQRKRFVMPFGILRGVKVPEGLEDEELDGAYIDYIAHFIHGQGRYMLRLKEVKNESLEYLVSKHKRRSGASSGACPKYLAELEKANKPN